MARGYNYRAERGSNPFDYDEEPGGFGGNSTYGQRDYSRGSQEATDDDLEVRKQLAIRRMEESSASSLRSLNETYQMGVNTAVELDSQADTLDRVERRLDEMHVDLDKGKRNMRLIKSPFGGIANYFSKRSSVKDVTDPKGYEQRPSKSSAPPKETVKKRPDSTQLQQYESTGSTVVDENLDEMSKQLDRLMGVGHLIGASLDDSEDQIDRVRYKVDRNKTKVEAISKDIKTQL